MNKGILLATVITIVTLGLIAFFAYIVNISFDTTLEFRLQDVNSKANVWDVNITLHDRIIYSYFDIVHKFSNLKPGEYIMQITAPYYLTKTVPLKINSGANIIEDPIDLIGYEIPNLDGFYLFQEQIPAGLKMEIRPQQIVKGNNGENEPNYQKIVNHPCLDIKIGIRLCEQLKQGVFVQEITKTGCARGEELFSGVLKWEWDANPQTTYRYSVLIPKEKIKKTKAQYWVIDLLILVPNPQRISEQELYTILEGVKDITDVEELDTYFKPYEKKLKYFYESFWNSKGLKRE